MGLVFPRTIPAITPASPPQNWRSLPPYAARAGQPEACRCRGLPLIRACFRSPSSTFVTAGRCGSTWRGFPQFFLHSYQLNLAKSALFAAGVFFAGVVGDALGGIASDRVLEKTGDRNKARRNLVVFGFLCSLAVMAPILFFHNLAWAAICLSAGVFLFGIHYWPDVGHSHGYRAAIFAARASGLMNTGSALAAIISPLIFGYVIDKTGTGQLPFIGNIGLLLLGFRCWRSG